MPARPEEVAEAEEEGVKIHYLASPTRIISENGRVVAMECIRLELGAPDESGRRRPIPIPGSEIKSYLGHERAGRQFRPSRWHNALAVIIL